MVVAKSFPKNDNLRLLCRRQSCISQRRCRFRSKTKKVCATAVRSIARSLAHRRRRVPLPGPGTQEGDSNVAAPPSIVDPASTVRSRVIGQTAIAASRAATGGRPVGVQARRVCAPRLVRPRDDRAGGRGSPSVAQAGALRRVNLSGRPARPRVLQPGQPVPCKPAKPQADPLESNLPSDLGDRQAAGSKQHGPRSHAYP